MVKVAQVAGMSAVRPLVVLVAIRMVVQVRATVAQVRVVPVVQADRAVIAPVQGALAGLVVQAKARAALLVRAIVLVPVELAVLVMASEALVMAALGA